MGLRRYLFVLIPSLSSPYVFGCSPSHFSRPSIAHPVFPSCIFLLLYPLHPPTDVASSWSLPISFMFSRLVFLALFQPAPPQFLSIQPIKHGMQTCPWHASYVILSFHVPISLFVLSGYIFDSALSTLYLLVFLEHPSPFSAAVICTASSLSTSSPTLLYISAFVRSKKSCLNRSI